MLVSVGGSVGLSSVPVVLVGFDGVNPGLFCTGYGCRVLDFLMQSVSGMTRCRSPRFVSP